jgi:hypothetical protein
MKIRFVVKDGVNRDVLVGVRKHGTRDIEFHADIQEALAKIESQVQWAMDALAAEPVTKT